MPKYSPALVKVVAGESDVPSGTVTPPLDRYK